MLPQFSSREFCFRAIVLFKELDAMGSSKRIGINLRSGPFGVSKEKMSSDISAMIIDDNIWDLNINTAWYNDHNWDTVGEAIGITGIFKDVDKMEEESMKSTTAGQDGVENI